MVMGRFRLTAVACLSLLLAACGGTTKQSSIRPATASRLASQSQAVAAALQRGDSCGAATQAQALQRRVAVAIASGAIPSSLAAPARTASTHLASSIVCTPPPPPPAPGPASVTCAHDARKEHGGGKHKKGPDDAARGQQDDQQENGPDRQRKGCK
jgi:hypothetical protein